MAEDVKADDVLDQLRASFAHQIRHSLRDLPAHQTLQVADALCAIQMETLAGLRVLYRAAPKIDGEAIAEDWRCGLPLQDICQRHRVAQRTAYKYHPSKPTPRRRVPLI